jgi:hypothetical protein
MELSTPGAASLHQDLEALACVAQAGRLWSRFTGLRGGVGKGAGADQPR